ncbi:MAG: hypothetical protein ACOX4R_07525 [Lentihominibacter sp.]
MKINLEKTNERLKDYPKGYLEIFKRGANYNYIQRFPNSEGKRGKRKGITRDKDLICKLAWKLYDTNLQKILITNIAAMEKLVAAYVDPTSDEVINKLKRRDAKLVESVLFEKDKHTGNDDIPYHKGNIINMTPDELLKSIKGIKGDIENYFSADKKGILVKGYTLGDELLHLNQIGVPNRNINLDGMRDELIKAIQIAWSQMPYKMSTYREEEKNKITSRGLKVRSKAEVLVAEELYRNNVPFLSEVELWLGDERIEPDFTFLAHDGSLFYWEYCGMMDDERYVRGHIKKRNLYERYGIVPWKNIIYTYDINNEINMREIECVIKNYILPKLNGYT